MKQLNSVIKSIGSKSAQAVAESLATAFLLQGKIQALEAVLNTEKVRVNGNPLPDSAEVLKLDLEVLQRQYEVEQAKALKAVALSKVEALARDAGARNPSLVVLAIQDKVQANVDNSGDIKIQVVSEVNKLPEYNPKTGSPYTAGEFIQSMRVSSEYANLFGEGKPEGYAAIQNPWKKETFNLTQQGRIIKDNPALASKMMTEAGILR